MSTSFEKARQKTKESEQHRQYFIRFALRHKKEIRILQKAGVLGNQESRDWRNVGEHCLVEAVAADILAEHLGAKTNVVVSVAFIHDWYKRREIEAMRQGDPVEAFRRTSQEDEALLLQYGVDEELIKIAHSNISETADVAVLAQRTVEQKIMHYVDVITNGTEYIGVEARLDQQTKPHQISFSNSFQTMYNGQSLFEVQRAVGIAEQTEFEQQLGLAPGTLVDFIKDQLSHRFAASG